MYFTFDPILTFTGSFLWLYIAVVSVSSANGVVSIFGILLSAFANFTPSTSVIYFLNAKSNSFSSLSINIIGCLSVSVALTYKVIFDLGWVVPSIYPWAFAFAVFIK